MTANNKNWLIRTTQKQILGPISKEKVREFVEKNSLIGDDEVTSGNGYWFKIKEKDLVEKYLLGDVPQGFNPIEEAPAVLSLSKNKEFTSTINPSGPKSNDQPPPTRDNDNLQAKFPEGDDLALPDMGDLEYPDMPTGQTDDTLQVSIDQVHQSSPIPNPSASHDIAPGTKPVDVAAADDELTDGLIPDARELEYPDIGGDDVLNSTGNEQTKPQFESLDDTPEHIDESQELESEIEEEAFDTRADQEVEAKQPVKKKATKKKERRKKKVARSNTETKTHVSLELPKKKKEFKINAQVLYFIMAVALGILAWVGFRLYKSGDLVNINQSIKVKQQWTQVIISPSLAQENNQKKK